MRNTRVASIGLGIAILMVGAATPGIVTAGTGTGEYRTAALSSRSTSTIVVHPGESIQAAVNRADPGDTVFIKPGHYRQSVLVAKNHIRIRGSGAGFDGTVIEPAESPRGLCARRAESGICVLDPQFTRTIVGVRVDNLMVRNFEADGVVGVGTRGFSVDNVTARHNGEYGITRFDSHGGSFINNVTTGSGDAGIYVGDSPRAHVFIAGNEVSNNGFGILVRNAKDASIQYNNVYDNCIGIVVWWVPGEAGDSDIGYNTARHNNKFCRSSEEVPFSYSGSGIALIGAQGVLVDNNSVLGNHGRTPVSGGIVVLRPKPAGGPTTRGNVIRRNSAFRNGPADLIDHSGASNTFSGNFCSQSTPAGLCRH